MCALLRAARCDERSSFIGYISASRAPPVLAPAGDEMKRSEEWARAKLSQSLARRGLKFSCKEGENPPDFVFCVEGEEQAVEVTELHQYIEAGREESTITTEHRLLGLIEKIDHKTAQRTRGYNILLKGPLAKSQERQILSAAKNYILASKDEPLHIGENNECEVTLKIGDKALAWVIMVNGAAQTPDGKVMLADIQGSIDHALSRILCEKVPRLKQSARLKKRVLVIVSEYFFADSENVRVGLQKRSGEIAPIDEVYLAWDSSFELVYP
jgi:hypothetical protein